MSRRSILSIFAVYFGITLASYIVIHYMMGIPYGVPQFALWKLPFNASATLATLWVAWKFKEDLPLKAYLPQNWLFWWLSFLPPLTIGLFFWVTRFQWQLTFFIPIATTLFFGLGEEFLFRRLLLNYLLDRFSFYKAIAISSLAFGLAHIIVIFAGSSIKQVATQVILATVMGFFYSFLYLYTRNIFAVSLDHATWDYMLASGALRAYPIIALAVPVFLLVRFIILGIMAFISRASMQSKS